MSRTAVPSAKFTHCVDSPGFNPDAYFDDADRHTKVNACLQKDDFLGAVTLAFQLPVPDEYVYYAMRGVLLAEAHHVVGLGGANNLHAWYRSAEDRSVALPPPTAQDSEAYTSIFQASTLTTSALKAFGANAKKNSVRAAVAAHLASKRYIHPALSAKLTVPRCKKAAPSPNPCLDFWAWSCRALEWCGPSDSSAAVPTSHHVLPVLMHHFGCATPSHEALEVLRRLADGRVVVDMGAGGGYWTFMLRRYGVEVQAVDNAQSAWRAGWIADTLIADGVAWLGARAGAKDAVLLLVYPIVGGGAAGGSEGGFTRGMVDAFAGDTLAVVGTQNRNGYTGFRDVTMDEFMAREHPSWTRVVQIPLPSFAGKDEALYVFQRGPRAPTEEPGGPGSVEPGG